MNEIELTGDVETALGILLPVGLCAILRDGADPTAVFRWDVSSGRARLGTRLEPDGVGQAVVDHASRVAAPQSWAQALITTGPRAGKGLFSPRVLAAKDDADRIAVLHERERWLHDHDAELTTWDRRMIGKLGEPAWWRTTARECRPDDGASRWEMKTRNRGAEFLQNRFILLAMELARRTPDQVMSGLAGTRMVDLLGTDANSRTPTGLLPPGQVDVAAAFCALSAIACLPVVARLGEVSASVGLQPRRGVHPHRCALPVFGRWTTPAAFEAVLTSRRFDAVEIPDSHESAHGTDAWLHEQGVHAIVSAEVQVSGSASASERMILRGRATVM